MGLASVLVLRPLSEIYCFRTVHGTSIIRLTLLSTSRHWLKPPDSKSKFKVVSNTCLLSCRIYIGHINSGYIFYRKLRYLNVSNLGLNET